MRYTLYNLYELPLIIYFIYIHGVLDELSILQLKPDQQWCMRRATTLYFIIYQVSFVGLFLEINFQDNDNVLDELGKILCSL